MKKTVLLVRHAKTEKFHESGLDFERKLTSRGKEDALTMVERLKKKGITIDHFFSSPAKRAKKTCLLFTHAYKAGEEKITYDESLYMPEYENFLKVIKNADDQYNDIAVFSHNPGITEFATSLCDAVRIDHMPTCSVFAVSTKIQSWKEFEKAEKKFEFFEQPRLI